MRHAVLLALLATVGTASGPCRAANDPAAPPGAPQPPAGEAAGEHFALLEFRVLNNSVLDVRQVERAVYPHLGPDKTIADVQAARADLEKAYRDAGYSTVYVDIPEQRVEEGVVRLAVTEGRLNRVAVTGTRFFLNRRILAAVPGLAPGTVPHFPDVQRQANALNQASPDLSVVPVLKPGSLPGTVDVDLKVKDQLPLHASVEVNNRYTADTSPTRLNVNLSYDNLFQRYQTLSLQYQTSPQDARDARVLAGTYLAPLPGLGGTLAIYAVDSSSDVATVGTLGVLGKGHVYGSRYIMPLTATGGFSPSLTLGVDLKNFEESILLASSPALQTPIKYLNWSIAYGGSLVKDRRSTSFNIATDFGIRGLLNNPAEFEDKRFLANPDYMYWHLDAAHLQPLPWGFEVALRAAGQYTTEPLIDNEQFAVGGVESVRGYLEAEALGDSGATGSLELRTPHLASAFGIHPREAYAYLFYDAGFVTLVDPLPTQVARQDLRSVGVGFRISGYAGFDAGLDWARALVATGYESANDSRIQFHFRYGF
jgi:hemolysin activation/secretion protein